MFCFPIIGDEGRLRVGGPHRHVAVSGGKVGVRAHVAATNDVWMLMSAFHDKIVVAHQGIDDRREGRLRPAVGVVGMSPMATSLAVCRMPRYHSSCSSHAGRIRLSASIWLRPINGEMLWRRFIACSADSRWSFSATRARPRQLRPLSSTRVQRRIVVSRRATTRRASARRRTRHGRDHCAARCVETRR